MNTDRHLKNELSELAAERNARKIKELREGSTEKPIDWQQVRIQAAIAVMRELCVQPDYNSLSENIVAAYSVRYADALVKKLKGE